MAERRKGRFAERLTLYLLALAAVGSAIVLLDPTFTYVWEGGSKFTIGTGEFSSEIKGGVVTIGILATISAIVRMWLPGNEQPPRIDTLTRATPPEPSKPNQGDEDAKNRE